MKRRIGIILLLFCILFAETAVAAPAISAPAAVLMDAESGLILYGKNENTRVYPASTTKIMTAILAIENGNLDDRVTVSFDAVNTIDFDSSKAGWFEGEVVSFRDLLYSLMVCSANDSANVIAEHLCGTQKAFADKMNERAAELGAQNTHFFNAHGLHNENHYTTAQDMAILARHAMSLPLFREIVALRTYTIEPTNKCEEKRFLNSTNHLLNPQSPYYYADAIGIKTGYTDAAQSCLVSAAKTGDVTYISTVFGATNDNGQKMSFVDSRTLLSFGAQACPPVSLVSAGDPLGSVPVQKAKGMRDMPVHADSAVINAMPEGVGRDAVTTREYIKTDLTAPVAAGDIIGRVEYYYGDILLGQTYMAADVSCEKSSLLARFFKAVFSSFIFYIVVLILLLLALVRRIRKIQRRKRAMRRRRANHASNNRIRY